MWLSNGDDPKRNTVLTDHMNNFHVHQKFIWSLEGHLPFQYIIGHFDWNPNFGSTYQGHNSFIVYDFEVGSNAIKLISLIQHFMHIWAYLSVLNHQFIKIWGMDLRSWSVNPPDYLESHWDLTFNVFVKWRWPQQKQCS